jgi:hypothetical protein
MLWSNVGLKINLSTSEIILGFEVVVDVLANIFGCSVARLPMERHCKKKWRDGWLVGRGCICQGVGGYF